MDTPIFMPDKTPVPEVMVESELIQFLRLDALGIKNPVGTLRHYREIGKLQATRIGGYNVYTRTSALEFLQKITKKNGEKN
jgi:hypothetical protein